MSPTEERFMGDKRLDVLVDRVISFVENGSHRMTDFVQQTAQELQCTKATVRAVIDRYDPRPGSPAGRPEKDDVVEEPEASNVSEDAIEEVLEDV